MGDLFTVDVTTRNGRQYASAGHWGQGRGEGSDIGARVDLAARICDQTRFTQIEEHGNKGSISTPSGCGSELHEWLGGKSFVSFVREESAFDVVDILGRYTEAVELFRDEVVKVSLSAWPRECATRVVVVSEDEETIEIEIPGVDGAGGGRIRLGGNGVLGGLKFRDVTGAPPGTEFPLLYPLIEDWSSHLGFPTG